MLKKRIIARIDIKNEYVIKGIHLEGLRKIGDPNDLAAKYYEQGIDEIIFMDAVAAFYDRNSLGDIIKQATDNIFVPITVGGGIRSIEDIKKALDNGADKVAINTQAVREPDFITAAAKVFGSQCIVASIEAKKRTDNYWEAFVENGREPTGLNVIEWAKRLEELGAGEIMVTSVDQDGTKKGFDISLSKRLMETVNIPLIVSGGGGRITHITQLLEESNVDAIAVASILHYEIEGVNQIKFELKDKGWDIRL